MIEKYLYIWDKKFTLLNNIHALKYDNFWFKIESNPLKLKIDYYDCYKIMGNTNSEINHNVEKIIKKVSRIKDLENQVEIILNYDNQIIDQLNFIDNKIIDNMKKAIFKKSSIIKQKNILTEIKNLLNDIENNVYLLEKSKLKSYLKNINNKLDEYNIESTYLDSTYNQLKIKYTQKQYITNIIMFFIGLICGIIPSILLLL